MRTVGSMRNLWAGQDSDTTCVSRMEGKPEIDFRKIRGHFQRWKENRWKLHCQIRQALDAGDLRVTERGMSSGRTDGCDGRVFITRQAEGRSCYSMSVSRPFVNVIFKSLYT